MSLIKNEIIKIVKQTSFKVISIILLVIVALTPIIIYFANNLTNIFSSYDDDWYKENRIAAEERGDVVEATYWRAQEDSEQFMKDIPNNKDDWKSTYYSHYVNKVFYIEYGLSLIVDKGYSVEKVINDSWGFEELKDLPYLTIYEDGRMDLYGYQPFIPQDDDEVLTNKTIFDLTQEEIESIYNDVKVAATKYKNFVKEVTLATHLVDKLDNYKRFYNEAQTRYEDAKTNYDENKSEELLYNLKCAELELKDCEATYKYFEKYYKDIESLNDWQYNAIENVLPSIYAKLESNIPMGKEQYESMPYVMIEISDKEYQAYVDECNKNYKATEKSLTYLVYALDNNIAPKELVKDSTRSLWESSILSYNSMFIIVGIVVASSIVAKEFSTGSIRLLLIRPKKRWKILLSKYLTVVISLLVIGIVNYLLSFGLSILVNGARDVWMSEILMIGSKAVAVPSLVGELIVLGRSFLSALLFSSLAFMIATLAKKTAVPIIISIVLLTFASTITLGTYLLDEFVSDNFLVYTVLPYLDMTIFTYSPIKEFIFFNGGILELTSSLTYYMTAGLKEWLGIIFVVSHIIIFDFFSFLSFIKSEIKS